MHGKLERLLPLESNLPGFEFYFNTNYMTLGKLFNL